MKVYRAIAGDLEPVEMECEEFGWPHKTTCGDTMHPNTHFLTLDAAWDAILSATQLDVAYSGSQVLHCQDQLQKAQQKAAEATKRFYLSRSYFSDFCDKKDFEKN